MGKRIIIMNDFGGMVGSGAEKEQLPFFLVSIARGYRFAQIRSTREYGGLLRRKDLWKYLRQGGLNQLSQYQLQEDGTGSDSFLLSKWLTDDGVKLLPLEMNLILSKDLFDDTKYFLLIEVKRLQEALSTLFFCMLQPTYN
jgi:hypothetical protein